MIIDAELEFSDSQAITATAASTNIVDLGIARDIGVGEEIYLVVQVDTTFADTGSDSTLAVTLETDDNTGFASAVVLETLVTLPALAAAGTTHYFRLSPAAYERYIRINYTPANGNLSAGAVSAFIVKDIAAYTSYTSGFTVS